MIIDLPWPPSVNKYWRHSRGMHFISAEGKAYRKAVVLWLKEHYVKRQTCRLNIEALAYPPDKRVRDIDNLPKALFDALKHGGLYEDDSQIDRFSIERMPVHKGGVVRLIIDRHEPRTEAYQPIGA